MLDVLNHLNGLNVLNKWSLSDYHRSAGFFHSRYVYERDRRSTAHDLGALRGDLSTAIFPSLARSLARARSPLQSRNQPAQRAAEEIGIQPVGCRDAVLDAIGKDMAGPTLATIQKILEGMIVPEMQAVKDRLTSMEGEIRGLRSEIKRLDDKIDNGLARLENKIDNGLARLEEKLSGQVARLDEKLTFTNKRLDEALEIRERLAALEAKVGR